MTTRVHHLTEEEFSDVVLGICPEDVQQHLEACEACAEEAALVQGSITSFAGAATTWSAMQKMPTPTADQFRSMALMHSLRPAFTFMAVAAMVVCVAIPVGRHKNATEDAQQIAEPAAASAVRSVAPVTAEQPEEVAATNANKGREMLVDTTPRMRAKDEYALDNEMMSTIHEEISEPVFVTIPSGTGGKNADVQME